MSMFSRKIINDNTKKVKKGTFIRLVKQILQHKIRVLFVIIGLIGSTAVSVVTNIFIKILIDDYITPMLKQDKNSVDFTPLIEAMTIFVSILLVGALCSFIYHLLMVKLSNNILRELREQMYKKMQKFPLSYFDMNKAGDIMSKYTNDLDTLRQVISQALPMTVNGFITFSFVIISMISLSLNLFLVVIFMSFVMVFITKMSSKYSFTNYRKTQKNVGELNSYVEEMVNGAKEIKVYCYESRNINAFVDRNEKWKDAIIKADTVSNMMMPIMNGIGNILYILLALIGGLILVNNIPNFTIFGIGSMTIGIISSFLSFTKTFSRMISELSSQLPFIMQSLSGAERIFDLIDNDNEIDNGNVIKENINENEFVWNNKNEKVPLVGNIVFENVNFQYEENKPVLKNINIEAKRGQKIALVGATGAGKTTIINLLTRFYEVNNGTISFDGINISNIKKEDLRNSISLVLQDVNLFTGTIMENIKYGKLDATDEECIKASELACADDFIKKLPKGYETIIKGDSGGLSQGQKQLISIARAAIVNAPCLILDEATSSIDTRTEKLVQKGMESLMKGKTVFIIAHRLSTIREADIILVMKNGEIIERGNHDSLIKNKGYYYELYTGKIEID